MINIFKYINNNLTKLLIAVITTLGVVIKYLLFRNNLKDKKIDELDKENVITKEEAKIDTFNAKVQTKKEEQELREERLRSDSKKDTPNRPYISHI